MSTPVSSSAPYCTPAQFVVFHDWRNASDLCRDDDQRDASSAAFQESPILASLLLAASGEIESALVSCNRYSPSDLNILTGASAQYLQKLTADLTFWRMTQRRWPDIDPKGVQGAAAALDALEKLKQGVNIFGLQETANAGVPAVVQQWAPPPNKLSREAERFFGRRGLGEFN